MGMSRSTAVVDVTAAATDEVVAAVAGKAITVHGFITSGSASATVATFKSATRDISGSIFHAANATVVAPISHDGWFKTSGGEALNLTATTGNVTGCVVYSVG